MNQQNAHRIAIMGGAGYIGTVLSVYLRDLGNEVKVFDACWFGNHLPADIAQDKRDILNLKQEDLEGFDTVIFLAGLSNDPMAEFSPKSNFIYNTGMPAFIGFLAKEAGVKRLIFASSCSVYGFTRNSTFSESDPVACNYPYGVSKLQGEHALLAIADENFSVVCLRQGTVSGFSPRMRFDLAINTLFKCGISNGELVLSNSKIWRPILGLQDLCQAYQLALEAAIHGGEVFNISSFNTTIGDLAAELSAYLEKNHAVTVQVRDRKIQDYRNYKVNVDKARNRLGYAPQQDAQSIFSELSQHFDVRSNFSPKSYYNIEVFKDLMHSTPQQATLIT